MLTLLNPHRFPRPFAPDDLSGLAQWYDPSDTATLTMNGSTVAQMDDKSGNGDHATQGSAGAQPSLGSINGRQALFFSSSGADDTLVLPDPAGLSGSANRSLFVVFQVDIPDNSQGIVAYGTNSFNQAFAIATNSSDEFEFSIWGVAHGHSNLPGTDPHIGCAILNGARIGDCTVVLDGVAESASGSATVNTAEVGGARYGGLFDSSTFSLDGHVGEVILYGSALSEADRQKVEGYLAHKWGLAAILPVDHPYKSEAP